MKGDYYESIQKKYESINNSNNLIKDEISIRPISASIKRPDIFKFNKTAVKIQKTEFPTLLNHLSQNSQMSELQKAKSISKNVEKVTHTIIIQERLYDDNINLKSMISNLKKENNTLKTQINNLEVKLKDNFRWK